VKIDDIMAQDLDDLLAFKLYLAALQAGEELPVAAKDALAACDGLVARLSVQRWIAVRGAESEGEPAAGLEARHVELVESARSFMKARLDDRA